MSESLNPLPFPVQIDPDALGRVVVLMGGHSSERNVSLDSGRNVLKALQAKGVNAEAFDPAERSLGDLEKAGYDRAFIALHGRYGEDGTIQGVLEMLGIPYTGSAARGSVAPWTTETFTPPCSITAPLFSTIVTPWPRRPPSAPSRCQTSRRKGWPSSAAKASVMRRCKSSRKRAKASICVSVMLMESPVNKRRGIFI